MQLLFGLVEFNYRFLFLRVGRWKLRWYRLWWWSSPLRLRWSFRRLRLVSTHPYRDFARLLWPFPRNWPCVLPRPPRVLFSGPEAVAARYYRDSHVQRQLPLWARRDTPQRAFFRLYEAVCAADDVMIGYATEYLFFRPEPEWALHRLPDPRTAPTDPAQEAEDASPDAEKEDANPDVTPDATPDAERLAVMACVAASLEEVFNWRLELGLRRDGTTVERYPDGTPAPWTHEVRPAWTQQIPILPKLLVLTRDWDGTRDPAFWKDTYNVVIPGRGFRTI